MICAMQQLIVLLFEQIFETHVYSDIYNCEVKSSGTKPKSIQNAFAFSFRDSVSYPL